MNLFKPTDSEVDRLYMVKILEEGVQDLQDTCDYWSKNWSFDIDNATTVFGYWMSLYPKKHEMQVNLYKLQFN